MKHEFTHIVESNGFTYEVSGTVDVEQGMDGITVDDVVEYVDPYGLGLGIRRHMIPAPLKEKLTAVFMEEARGLFDQRAKLL